MGGRNNLDEPDRVNLVKAALENLREQHTFCGSHIAWLPSESPGEKGPRDVGPQLTDVVRELATSTKPRDAEAGRLLLEYYIERVGSHEVVMERLCLSRPTFYRRLKLGLVLVTRRLDELVAYEQPVSHRVSISLVPVLSSVGA